MPWMLVKCSKACATRRRRRLEHRPSFNQSRPTRQRQGHASTSLRTLTASEPPRAAQASPTLKLHATASPTPTEDFLPSNNCAQRALHQLQYPFTKPAGSEPCATVAMSGKYRPSHAVKAAPSTNTHSSVQAARAMTDTLPSSRIKGDSTKSVRLPQPAAITAHRHT